MAEDVGNVGAYFDAVDALVALVRGGRWNSAVTICELVQHERGPAYRSLVALVLAATADGGDTAEIQYQSEADANAAEDESARLNGSRGTL